MKEWCWNVWTELEWKLLNGWNGVGRPKSDGVLVRPSGAWKPMCRRNGVGSRYSNDAMVLEESRRRIRQGRRVETAQPMEWCWKEEHAAGQGGATPWKPLN